MVQENIFSILAFAEEELQGICWNTKDNNTPRLDRIPNNVLKLTTESNMLKIVFLAQWKRQKMMIKNHPTWVLERVTCNRPNGSSIRVKCFYSQWDSCGGASGSGKNDLWHHRLTKRSALATLFRFIERRFLNRLLLYETTDGQMFADIP